MSHPNSLPGLRGLDRASVESILDRAEVLLSVVDGDRSMEEVATERVDPAVVGLLFMEDSTRTRGSFEVAVHRLGHRPVTLVGRGSSASKGESLLDTAANLAAMGIDALVVRTGLSGGVACLAEALPLPVLNAGDGRHEHPTQGLLDASTLRASLGDLQGRRVAIVGDILNSRVARSGIHVLATLGAQIVLVGPPSLVPWRLVDVVPGARIEVSHDLDAVLEAVDAVMMLRIQRERDAGGSVASDYRNAFGMTEDRASRLAAGVPILHPGPVNRGVELDDGVLEDKSRSKVLDQVRRGVAVRMAILERALMRPGSRD
ncbi:MAG: aspartate carbamoyltransferase [Phycisphaerae bacterium]|nr:aspartate carbamoyltransferase [Phycisphaerae bacterium]